MNCEEKIKYLNQFSKLDAQIDALIKEKEKWYKRVLSIKKTDVDVDDSAKIINKVMLLEKEIEKNIDLIVDMRKNIVEAIELIDDFNCQQVVYMKYIKGLTFSQIGEELLYCERQVSRLHKSAIEKLELF